MVMDPYSKAAMDEYDREVAIEQKMERRVTEMMSDHRELLGWLYEMQSGLYEIKVTPPGGWKMDADEAVLRFAPPWLHQQIRDWLEKNDALRQEVVEWVDAPEED